MITTEKAPRTTVVDHEHVVVTHLHGSMTGRVPMETPNLVEQVRPTYWRGYPVVVAERTEGLHPGPGPVRRVVSSPPGKV